MAWSRFFSVLCALGLLASPPCAEAAEPALTADDIVAKARAVLTADPSLLAKVRGLQLNFTATDEKGLNPNKIILHIISPGYRHQATTVDNPHSVTVICAGRLEGWTTRQRGLSTQRELRPISYNEFRKLQDMAWDDLGFFEIPAGLRGQAEYKGVTEIDGVATHAIHYIYTSGFRITRHFNTRTFALVASDQLTPSRELIRQKIDQFQTAEGIRFPAKETIYIDGKKSGEVTYGKITINPALPTNFFDFPSF